MKIITDFGKLSGKFNGLVFRIIKIKGIQVNIVNKYRYFGWSPNLTMDAMVVRYNLLSHKELAKWSAVAKKKHFQNRYTAFASSFLSYVAKYGLGRALVDDIFYIESRRFAHSPIKIETVEGKISLEVERYLKKTGYRRSISFILPICLNSKDIAEGIKLNLLEKTK